MHAIALAPQREAEGWILALEATVDGRMVDVAATRSGRIDRVLVAEGEQVGKGARLIELDHVASGAPRARRRPCADERPRIGASPRAGRMGLV
jgi:hypothetical protein